MDYVTDWQAVPTARYAEAQAKEREWWSERDAARLTLHAEYYFYAGYYEWTKHRALLNPFRVNPEQPLNFQVAADEIEGRDILDLGCGPMSHTLSLVHCARVHALDPLIPFYRQIQPFGWDCFASLSSAGAEQLPFERESLHFVHCWNVLDHTKDADRILNEIVRVLVPDGQLLFACDARPERGGGAAHPYQWTIDALESRLLGHFMPVTPAGLWDHESGLPVSRAHKNSRTSRWICRLRKRADSGT